MRMLVYMEILTIASQKGGAGKTTLSAHLAVEAERVGNGPVAVVDTDPQGSLADWWNQRRATTPLFASVEVVRLSTHMAELRQQRVSLVVIDTPPALLDTIRAAIAVADLVLIPARVRMTCERSGWWSIWLNTPRNPRALWSTVPRHARRLRWKPYRR
jgi:cellulose biosynthesis protein BcsQ